jgi:excisionase family DNA binding protein
MDYPIIFKTPEAAKYLDVKKSTVEAWRCRGGGPAFIRYNRAIRYRKSDLDNFIEKGLRHNTSDQSADADR